MYNIHVNILRGDNMKKFKYLNDNSFIKFLKEYNYSISDIISINLDSKNCCHGAVFKAYLVSFKDGEELYFNVAVFKDFNRLDEARLGFLG